MEIIDPITRVRAAKTSGECRKNIADASHALGVASQIRETFDKAKKALEADKSIKPEALVDLLSGISAQIRSQEADANRNLDATLNAILKAFVEVKDISDKSKKLEITRTIFETVESFLPKTEK